MSLQIEKQLTPKLGIAPAVIAATADGTGIDCSKHEEVVYVLLIAAVVSLTSWDVKIQESETVGGSYTDISGAAFAQITTADHEFHLGVRVNTAKPFQRVSHTLVGTSVAASVALLLAKPGLIPAAAGA